MYVCSGMYVSGEAKICNVNVGLPTLPIDAKWVTAHTHTSTVTLSILNMFTVRFKRLVLFSYYLHVFTRVCGSINLAVYTRDIALLCLSCDCDQFSSMLFHNHRVFGFLYYYVLSNSRFILICLRSTGSEEYL